MFSLGTFSKDKQVYRTADGLRSLLWEVDDHEKHDARRVLPFSRLIRARLLIANPLGLPLLLLRKRKK
jgi:hypothetical protein